MQTSRIEILGTGSSMPLAQDAYYRFMRLGLPAAFSQDMLYASISASQLPENSCAFVISHTGRTNSVLNAAGLARQRGAKVIALTSFAVSPLTQMADVSLLAISGEAKAYEEALTSRLTKMLIVDSICAYIAAKGGVKAMRNLDNEIEVLESELVRKPQ